MLRYSALILGVAVALGVSAAGAQEPTLEVSSPGSRCDAPLTLRGERFEPGDTFSVGIPGMIEMTFLAAVEVTADGSFVATVGTLDSHGYRCVEGGHTLFFAYRGVGQLVEVLARGELAFATPMRLTLVACAPLVVEGTGFPPDRALVLLGGDDSPVAHDFAELDIAHTDDAGSVRFEVPQPRSFCSWSGALFVRLYRSAPEDVTVEARISLPSGVQAAPPLPAATGHGVAQPSRGRGPLVLLAALVALAVALVRIPARSDG
jgi:hypothetical protein